MLQSNIAAFSVSAAAHGDMSQTRR